MGEEKMTETLEYKLEGIVTITSGRLLIIDPSYLLGFDYDVLTKGNSHDIEWLKLMEEETHIIIEEGKAWNRYSKAIDRAEKNKDIQRLKKDSVLYTNKMEDTRKKRKVIEQKQKEIQEQPSFRVPYIAQGDGWVVYANPIGDGRYPIVRTPRRIKICYDADEDALEGIIGHTYVCSAMNIIIDASKHKISRKLHKENRCVIPLPNGEYHVRSAKKGYELTMKI